MGPPKPLSLSWRTWYIVSLRRLYTKTKFYRSMLLYVIVMVYQKLSEDIFELDRSVLFAAICDRTGEIKYGGIRDGKIVCSLQIKQNFSSPSVE